MPPDHYALTPSNEASLLQKPFSNRISHGSLLSSIFLTVKCTECQTSTLVRRCSTIDTISSGMYGSTHAHNKRQLNTNAHDRPSVREMRLYTHKDLFAIIMSQWLVSFVDCDIWVDKGGCALCCGYFSLCMA